MSFATPARWLAIGIAILGVVDPSLTSMRRGKPDVAVITTARRDTALARRIRESLDDRFAVIDGAWDRAAATVIVGNALPDHIPPGAIYAIIDTMRPAITAFEVPPRMTADARTPIRLAARGGTASLRADGVIVSTGPVSAHVPTSPGPHVLSAVTGSDTVTALTDVIAEPHAVLFFDRRPSWMSTFVRRSLEQDRRFVFASRVITSRGVSTDAGRPPSTLADPTLLEVYDVIVVGAPASLTAGDVAGLETFLRRRGGAVMLLYDEIPAAGAHDRLTGVTRWTPAALRAPVNARADDDSVALRFTEAAWPASLPATADPRASARITTADRPLVWATGLGAGQVIVSGALDAWKFRDRSTSGFDEYWRATISRAAREARGAVTVEAVPNVVAPGERLTVRVTVRDTLARPEARLDASVVPLWRGDRAGEYVGRIRAPASGEHRLSASAGGARDEAPILVQANVQRVVREDIPALELLARASGGAAGSAEAVERAIRDRVVAEQRMERWWPMRSGWWIVPFVALLGVEWLVRRRRGLA